jgi:putative ATP-binding cassette transporter
MEFIRVNDSRSFLARAWALAVPYYRGDEKWSARGLLASVIALDLLRVALSVQLNYWNRGFYTALQEKDWDGFIGLLLLGKTSAAGWAPGFTLLAFTSVAIAVYRVYLNQGLRMRWRRWMTQRYLNEWLTDQAYYRISLLAGSEAAAGTDNPDQRIAEDLRDFTDNTLALGLGLLSSTVTLVSFVAILWSLSGPLDLFGVSIPGFMVWIALIYAAIGTVATHYVGRKLTDLDFQQQRREADFRFGLARLRENVEGIALLGGEAREASELTARFSGIVANWWDIMRRTRLLNAVTAGYGQASVIFPFVLAAPRYFAGAIPLGGLTQTSSAFGQVEGALSFFVSAYPSIASWRATVTRLLLFHDAMATASRGGAATVDTEAGGTDWRASGLKIALPDGSPVLDADGFSLRAGESVVVTGASGSGKSTLLRVLAGIWPYAAGKLHRPPQPAMFLPQRPYLPLGTLRAALTYPATTAGATDTALREALAAVGLGPLAARLDEEDHWALRLSGGEQQRLSFARALLVRPRWLFLDEATSNLDTAAEAALYDAARDRLSDTTIVSVTHREAVAAWHARRLDVRGGILVEAVA